MSGLFHIIKRDGKEADFDKQKIINAITKANNEVEEIHRLSDVQIEAIADSIEDQIRSINYAMTVEDIQELVEKGIMEMRGFETAQHYIRYRYKRTLARNANNLDNTILSLIDLQNEEIKQENSNKNPVINSTQRDYMAGEVSKDITRRLLLDKDIVEAHDKGIIHFHDMDYFAQRSNNCFMSNEKLITDKGVKAFKELKDGEIINVMDKDGYWRSATVHCYGQQAMQTVTFKAEPLSTIKQVVCTANHRWILKDGSVTTNLKVGDSLINLKETDTRDNDFRWHVISIEPYHDGSLYDAWCVEEPVTHSFTLEGEMVTGNCCLVNLEDMLQNGTCISGTRIDKPHSFYTACNITTQIVAQVASSQYGGQTWTLAHIAPFVDISRQKLRSAVKKEFEAIGIEINEDKINQAAELRLKDEIKAGMQTIQYQLITLMTCNGQAPFVSVFAWLDEVPEGQLRDDLALIIEEMLKQRIQGVKNPSGVWITPAFPKILYVLDEDNITPESKYWYLTVLAAKCTAKRMVPDYISAKKMREYKNGDVYACMGCRSFLTPDIEGFNEDGSHKYYGRLTIEVGASLNCVNLDHGCVHNYFGC